MHSETKKYNYINIVKMSKFLCPNFEILPKVLTNKNFWDCACTPAATVPASLKRSVYSSTLCNNKFVRIWIFHSTSFEKKVSELVESLEWFVRDSG